MSDLENHINNRIDCLDNAMEQVHPSSNDHTRYSAMKTAYIHMRERMNTHE